MTPPRTRRFGKRAFAMLACSYIWLLLGFANYRDLPTLRPNVAHLELSPTIRGVMWLVPVVVALATCLSRRASWLGIMVLFFPAGLTMVSFGMSWVASRVPGGSEGYADGWYQSAVYLGACLIPVLAALFPSPPVIEVDVSVLTDRTSR